MAAPFITEKTDNILGMLADNVPIKIICDTLGCTSSQVYSAKRNHFTKLLELRGKNIDGTPIPKKEEVKPMLEKDIVNPNYVTQEQFDAFKNDIHSIVSKLELIIETYRQKVDSMPKNNACDECLKEIIVQMAKAQYVK